MNKNVNQLLDLILRAKYAISRFQDMHRSPLKMQEAAPLLRKALRRAEASRREAKKVNENRLEKTNRQKQTLHSIVGGLIKKDPHLRQLGKQTKLAQSAR